VFHTSKLPATSYAYSFHSSMYVELSSILVCRFVLQGSTMLSTQRALWQLCRAFERSFGSSTPPGGVHWEWMKQQGHKINPCNSQFHPAVLEAGMEPEGDQVLAVQVAYTPESTCFGCGAFGLDNFQ
jgi:hypothetical protein